jgi:hypothetical protein
VRPRWFCRDEREWLAFALRLKQMPCPHCDAVGELIRHGVLLGYDENCPPRKTIRARRVFCSNRDRRRGCMIEAVRSANKIIDLDNVNRVLMQPHWQKDADLVDF